MLQTRQSFYILTISNTMRVCCFFRRITIVLVNITGQRLAIDLRRLRIQKDISPSEVSREVEIQLAAFDVDPAAPRTLSTVEFP